MLFLSSAGRFNFLPSLWVLSWWPKKHCFVCSNFLLRALTRCGNQEFEAAFSPSLSFSQINGWKGVCRCNKKVFCSLNIVAAGELHSSWSTCLLAHFFVIWVGKYLGPLRGPRTNFFLLQIFVLNLNFLFHKKIQIFFRISLSEVFRSFFRFV